MERWLAGRRCRRERDDDKKMITHPRRTGSFDYPICILRSPLSPAVKKTVLLSKNNAPSGGLMQILLFLLLFSCGLASENSIEDHEKWKNFNISQALPNELKTYQNYLRNQLAQVEEALNHSTNGSPTLNRSEAPNSNDILWPEASLSDPENSTTLPEDLPKSASKKSKRFVPISASIPNTESNYFLDRIGSLMINYQPLDDNSTMDFDPSNLTSAEITNIAEKANLTKTEKAKALSALTFNPTKNHTVDECKQLTKAELIRELKRRGTYNPDLMAWDASGVFRFLDRSIVDQYERQTKSKPDSEKAVERNVQALENLLKELNLQCDVRTPDVYSRIHNLTVSEPRRTISSPHIRLTDAEIRRKRHIAADHFVKSNITKRHRREDVFMHTKQKLIGDVIVVPFGCDKRGEEEDGYLRLCGACQAIRKLPETFFPPFINEVMCDVDQACLYFYDYPHGKCKQKHMNFVVLRNVGTPECQIWQKFNLNVRVSCECFVDEMSFFAKYV